MKLNHFKLPVEGQEAMLRAMKAVGEVQGRIDKAVEMDEGGHDKAPGKGHVEIRDSADYGCCSWNTDLTYEPETRRTESFREHNEAGNTAFLGTSTWELTRPEKDVEQYVVASTGAEAGGESRSSSTTVLWNRRTGTMTLTEET